MGKGRHNPEAMINMRVERERSGHRAFEYSTATLRSGGKLHPALDPAYGGSRESRDLDAETTYPIVVNFDVTGSNAHAARKVHQDLPQLLGLLTVQSWVKEHLNIQIAATGDVFSDQYPFQLSPFESEGTKIDQWLERVVLESGGGIGLEESYETMFWMLCHQNRLDCWKRGKRAALFVIFDELPYPYVAAENLRRVYGAGRGEAISPDEIQLGPTMRQGTLASGFELPAQDVALNTVVADLKSKYDVTCINCAETQYATREDIRDAWRRLFGAQSVVQLPNASDVSELIAAIVGSRYGVPVGTIQATLEDLGTSGRAIDVITTTLAAIPATTSTVIPASKSAGRGVTRL